MNNIRKIAALAVSFLLLTLLAACNKAEVDTETLEAEQETIMVTEADPGPSPSGTLVGTAWWVEDILGGGVIDSSRTTIGFTLDGIAAGNGGCNRFTGAYKLDGENISMGPFAGTMMACPEALMNQDRSFHEALEQVTSWRIDAQTGLLHLQNQAGETVIRASALPAGEQA